MKHISKITKLIFCFLILCSGKCNETKVKANEIKFESIELFYLAPDNPREEMHVWKSIIQISDTSGVIKNFLDQFATDATDTQIRRLNQSSPSPNFDYKIHFNTLNYPSDCNLKDESYHRFLISENEKISELGYFTAKQSRFPPPFGGSITNRNSNMSQENLADLYDLSIIKLNRKGQNLEISCEIRESKGCKEMRIEKLSIGSNSFYALQIIKATDDLQNVEIKFTKTIEKFDSSLPIVMYFLGDEMYIDFKKECIKKEAFF